MERDIGSFKPRSVYAGSVYLLCRSYLCVKCMGGQEQRWGKELRGFHSNGGKRYQKIHYNGGSKDGENQVDSRYILERNQ